MHAVRGHRQEVRRGLLSAAPARKSRINANARQGFKKTNGSNFGGGNTAWEEKSLGTYASRSVLLAVCIGHPRPASETRLLEILDGVCEDKDYSCDRLKEEAEEHIEEFWQKMCVI